MRLANTDPVAATRIARSIKDPWYRTQALAWVTRFGQRERVESLLREAVSSAGRARDPYDAAAVLAWPLRAALELGLDPGDALGRADFVALARAIPHPVRRVSALELLWAAGCVGPDAVADPLLEGLIEAARSCESWRAARALVDALAALGEKDPDRARALAEGMRDGRWRRAALARLARLGSQAPREPRPFFW